MNNIKNTKNKTNISVSGNISKNKLTKKINKIKTRVEFVEFNS